MVFCLASGKIDGGFKGDVGLGKGKWNGFFGMVLDFYGFFAFRGI